MMNQMYGFDGEVKAKYSVQMAELFTEVYNWLPLAHCLNHKVLVSIFQTLCAYIFIVPRMRYNSYSYSFILDLQSIINQSVVKVLI